MLRRALFVLLLAGVLALGVGPGDTLFSPLPQIYQVIRSTYYKSSEIPDSQLLQGAIRGLIESLNDPYSVYFTPEKYRQWEESLAGEYSGVGMEITLRNKWVTVVSPLPGTPAEAAGIKPGDVILAVDGESTEGWTLEMASSRIRGPAGTTVTLTLKTQDGTLRDVTLVRQRIVVESVRHEYKAEERVGYVRILRFDVDTGALVGRALYSFPLQNLAGIIVDLRNNTGGLLSTAVDAASYFIDSGVIVRTKGPAVGDRPYSSRGNNIPNLPLAVLVNEGTASAAEIMAGAIQDYRVGVLIGRKTFGKGLVQEIVMRLPDGGAIKLTTAEYFTPLGRAVQEVGLKPDIEVPKVEDGDQDLEMQAALEWIRTKAGQPAGVSR